MNNTTPLFIAFILLSVVGVQEYEICFNGGQCIFNPNFSKVERLLMQYQLSFYTDSIGIHAMYVSRGSIDDIKVWNYKISEEDAKSLYNGLIFYNPFEEGITWENNS